MLQDVAGHKQQVIAGRAVGERAGLSGEVVK
jgi:hypothetical protein